MSILMMDSDDLTTSWRENKRKMEVHGAFSLGTRGSTI